MVEVDIQIRPDITLPPGLQEQLPEVVRRAIDVASADLASRGLPVPRRPAEVAVLLTDDDEIRSLNECYRGENRPTDVLSFPMWDPPVGDEDDADEDGPPELLGDVVISVPRAMEQASAYGHSAAREIAYLLVHGVLHLLGFDHHTDEEKAEMRRLEEAVLEGFSLQR